MRKYASRSGEQGPSYSKNEGLKQVLLEDQASWAFTYTDGSKSENHFHKINSFLP